MSKTETPDRDDRSDIAVIGMAGRFPGARTVDEFWQNLRNGVESVSFFTDEELLSAGIPPAVLASPDYVKAKAGLEGVELFDAAFFGFNPREAEIIDPQQRLFLECAWEAIESAGYDPERGRDLIGVYAGSGINTYLLDHLYQNREALEAVGRFQVFLGSDKDFLATRVAYRLNLKGPAVTVQTACSTSLVAVHLACQGLLSGDADMALAGGVSIQLPQKSGYVYQEGGILSPDGHCRAFDAQARGTIFGSGVGVVVLKRLEDAIAHGDFIHAVIKGSAINNDGSAKAGYTAPGIEGQASVIRAAQVMADIEPHTVQYIEAHGTGTTLGDPIEIAALTQAFRAGTGEKAFCAVGSVKTNVGHLDAAAGVTGLIKTVLALKHQLLPPSLHYETANPTINFAETPFYINSQLSEWRAGESPRRAGVSSFGIGGTNAHVIVEEAPARQSSGPSRPCELLLLSARTEGALETLTANLADSLTLHREWNLADVAFTLKQGRKTFEHRRALVCKDVSEAVEALQSPTDRRRITGGQAHTDRPVVFMFSGQGTQYVNMALELYGQERAFREQVDTCSALLEPYLLCDLRRVLYPAESGLEQATDKLNQTSITQPALFVVEYALANLLMQWGVRPESMIGHSIGEYVAACVAGVLSLKDALALVALRGRLMQEQPRGAMIAVPLAAAQVEPLLNADLSIAAINSPSLCVVAGPTAAVNALRERLAGERVDCRRLNVSHAFHSAMMEPVVASFAEQVKKVTLKPPRIAYVSNVTGTWITAEQATDCDYWGRHLRQTVRFADGLQELLKEPERILLEVGPGQTLSGLARRQAGRQRGRAVLSSLRREQDQQSDAAYLLKTLGQLWLAGKQPDWDGFYAGEDRLRLALPTYPFERERFWLERPEKGPGQPRTHALSTAAKQPVEQWFYVTAWKQAPLPPPAEPTRLEQERKQWLIFADEPGRLGARIAGALESSGHDVIVVRAGQGFAEVSRHEYVIDPRRADDYYALLKEIRESGRLPSAIIHLWNSRAKQDAWSVSEAFEASQYDGFYSLLFLAQAIGKNTITSPLAIYAVSAGLHNIAGESPLCPERATALGPCKVIPQEFPNITCRSIDISYPPRDARREEEICHALISEFTSAAREAVVAYRGNDRWAQGVEPLQLTSRRRPARLREQGVYLITGGLGHIGLILARYLAQTCKARLVLTGRSVLPHTSEWNSWLQTHDEQDLVSRKIRKLEELNSLGAECLVLSADVSSVRQMQEAVAQARERFGVIHGVIHAAGIVGEPAVRAIQETGLSQCEGHFRPKVQGVWALERIFQHEQLDFCMMMSSLSSILGGVGYLAYAAANIFMDAFARQKQETGPMAWVSVNWDGWQPEDQQAGKGFRPAMAEWAITPEEGAQVFDYLFHADSPDQLIVSTRELKARVEQWVERGPAQPLKDSPGLTGSSSHTRPNTHADFVAPGTELEQGIAEIWRALLGFDEVGVHDNFFELGGHSLAATQLLSRLRETFEIDLPMRCVFENCTIANLALEIESCRSHLEAEPFTTINLASLAGPSGVTDRLDSLSDDEVRSLLIDLLADKGADQ